MLLSINVEEPSIPLEHPYPAPWASERQAEQSGTANIWLPIRDINGLSEAITALFRAESKSHGLSPAEQEQRVQLLQLARKIITAERELQLKQFAKLLGHALSTTT